MAEAFGIAGSAFGTVSLGIQLFTEISNYLSSVEGRDEDLERAKTYALDFHSSLIALETLASTTGISDSDLERVINQGQANCASAIKNLSKMVAELKGQGPIPNSRTSKARNLYIKLKYPFKKQNLENLEKQLFNTVSVLKFALTILQLNSTRIIQMSVQSMERAMSSHLTRLLNPHRDGNVTETSSESAISLRDPTSKTPVSGIRETRYQNGAILTMDSFCVCRKNFKWRERRQWGPFIIENEMSFTDYHSPGCPLSTQEPLEQQTKRTLKFPIPFVQGRWRTAIQFSHFFTSGIGGMGFGQSLACAKMVDGDQSPSFKIVQVAMHPSDRLTNEDRETLFLSCYRRLKWCFATRRASITDVDQYGRSIVDHTTRIIREHDSGEISLIEEGLQVFYLEFGQLSRLILLEDNDKVQNHLKKYPLSINEVNYLGQTPIHIAVQIQNARILSELVNHADGKVLNTKDNNGHYAIDLAIDALIHARRSVTEPESTVCNGCEVLNVLLRSESAIFRNSVKLAMQLPWFHGIRACIEGQKNIIRSLASRRKNLKTLAHRELTPAERQSLKFCQASILDQNAAQTQRFLEAKKCQVPIHLKVYDDDESPEDSESVYLLISHGDVADSALQSGFFMPMTLFDDVFRSLAEFLNRGPRGLQRQDFLFSSYICWLVDHGGDLHSTISTLWGYTTAAHYFMAYLSTSSIDGIEAHGPLTTGDRHEIEEEDNSLLELLEKLVTEFEMERGNYADLLSFARQYWAPRMEAVHQEIESCILTETQLQSAEAVGVVWECYGPQLPLCSDGLTIDEENEEEVSELEKVLRELDEIATDPARPSLV
ncbi:hypothetical protein FCIRC_2987 [Fusarium circinatum]|uniref:Ankyrin repeat protein n=1 Tax=Fusarium circinatum TaxID=48490 RepID=A0A8H5X9M5_FUSCI|nr:hypothetical protein FCIRC_2987 [Fusarium circinatum]